MFVTRRLGLVFGKKIFRLFFYFSFISVEIEHVFLSFGKGRRGHRLTGG